METIKTGRELDARIAERIFGLEVIVYPSQHEGREPCVFFNVGDGEMCKVPAYSTEITAAWQVVEKMPDFHLDRGDDWFWRCSMKADENGNYSSPAVANSAPLAICLAALAAVGEGVGA